MKRLLLAIAMFATFQSFAQTECDSILKTETDKFDGSVSINPDPIVFKREGKEIGAFAATRNVKAKYIGLIFLIYGNGCIDDNAKITFLFEDNSKAVAFTFGKFNCDDNFTIVSTDKDVKKDKSILTYLSQKKLTAARFSFRKGYKDIDFTEDESNTIKQIASCLFKNVVKPEESTK